MFLRFGLITFVLAAIVAAILRFGFRLDVLTAWLAAVNLAAFFTFGYDKFIAGSMQIRVPEKVLLALVFFGGPAGALAGMVIFHHKTVKTSFQVKFWGLILLEAGIAVVLIFLARS